MLVRVAARSGAPWSAGVCAHPCARASDLRSVHPYRHADALDYGIELTLSVAVASLSGSKTPSTCMMEKAMLMPLTIAALSA
jgi:hypothetical protein